MSNFWWLPYYSYDIGVQTENPPVDYCPDPTIRYYDQTNTVQTASYARHAAIYERIMVTAIFDRSDYSAAMIAAGFTGGEEPIPVGIQLCVTVNPPNGVECQETLPALLGYQPDIDEVRVNALFRVPPEWAGLIRHVNLIVSLQHGSQTDQYVIPFQIWVAPENKELYSGDEPFTEVVWKKDGIVIDEICERTGLVELHATHDKEGWVPIAIVHRNGNFTAEFDGYDSDNLDAFYPLPPNGFLKQLPVTTLTSQGTQTEVVQLDTSLLQGDECVTVIIKAGSVEPGECELDAPEISCTITWVDWGGLFMAYVDWEIAPPVSGYMAMNWNVHVINAQNSLPTVYVEGPDMNTGSFQQGPYIAEVPFYAAVELGLWLDDGDGNTCYWFYKTDYHQVRIVPVTFEDRELVLIT